MENLLPHITTSKPDVNYAAESAILKTLLYFDIFNYPLTIEEIKENCHAYIYTIDEIHLTLNSLIEKGIISEHNGFYYMHGKESIILSRVERNTLAKQFIPKALRYSKLISHFPFVEAVFITGSLAKECMDETGDIDYFIVTSPNRLWLCRGVLTLFKKVFLLNSRKFFCINYYVDAESLNIPDKNIYTATEVIFAKPIYNAGLCKKFYDSNTWTNHYYPNKSIPDMSLAHAPNKSVFKKTTERVFKGWMGDKVDTFFFNLFTQRWKTKFKKVEADAFEVNFRSHKNTSKHHPNGFQFRVLKHFEQKIKECENQHGVSLM